MMNLVRSGIGKKIGAAALGVTALAGVAAATPSTAEAYHYGHHGGVIVENYHYRGRGISGGEVFLWSFLGSATAQILTNPCVLNPHACGSPHGGVIVQQPPVIVQQPPVIVQQPPVIIQQPVPVPVPVPVPRGPLHFDPLNGWHNHDVYSHPYGY